MAYRSLIDAERQIAFVEFSGTATFAEIERYIRETRAHPSFQPTFAHFVDAGAVTDTDLHVPELVRLNHMDIFGPTAKRVIVVQSNFIFGVVRMYQSVSERENMKLYRTRAEGFKFLGLPEDFTF